MNSQLYLLSNIEIDSSYEHTIDFDSITKQSEYFDSKINKIIPEDDYSYFRHNESIKIPYNLDDLFGINYLYYINDTKRYYCFITSKDYINDECTQLNIKVDVMQTFMFDYNLAECLVEREHRKQFKENFTYLPPNLIFKDAEENYDEVEEDVDYGSDYIIERKSYKKPIVLPNYHDVYFLYIYRSKPYNETQTGGFNDNGLPNLSTLYVLPFTRQGDVIYWKTISKPAQFATAEEFLTKENLQDDFLTQIFVSALPPTPLTVVTNVNNYWLEPMEGITDIFSAEMEESKKLLRLNARKIPGVGSIPIDTINRDKPDIDVQYQNADAIYDYPFKINLETKLKCYPYNFIKYYLGEQNIDFKRQLINTVGVNINAYQSLSGTGTSLMTINYKYADDHTPNYTITNQVPCFIDLLTNAWSQYLLQNRAQRTSGFVSTAVGSVINAAGGLLSGGFGIFGSFASLVGGASKISQQLTKEKDIKNQPDNLRQFNGDPGIATYSENLGVISYNFDVQPIAKERLARYFHHYGYKTNCMKTPDLKSRYYFNFIKTIEANIQCKLNSQIDHDYLNEIKDVYDKGITFWHYRDGSHFKGIKHYELANGTPTFYETLGYKTKENQQ